MSRAYSQDLRDRVIDAALSGDLSARGAGDHFGIGESTAVAWVRRARQGERMARARGKPKGSKLDAHRDYLLGLVGETPDLTISELQDKLNQERGVSASRWTVWSFLDRCGLTFKKRLPMRASRTARMC
jgi:transposase